MASTTFIMANVTAQPMPEASPYQFPIMMLILFGIMYVMMIRPQRRREKSAKNCLIIFRVETEYCSPAASSGRSRILKSRHL